VTLGDLNAMPSAEAERELLRCCGARRWATEMAGRRPFRSLDEIVDVSDRIWQALDETDWLEAFAAHPRIGASATAGEIGKAGGAQTWSAQEQSGVGDGSRRRFVELNRAYEERFHHIFIVCASGKSGAEMLDILERRMLNTPKDELREAAAQQRQITQLRLAKLIGD